MGVNIGLMKQAVNEFVGGANRLDEYALLSFQGRPQVVRPFAIDSDELLRAADRIQAGGSTAPFDAVHLAVADMRHAKYARKALLIVSDGMDYHSRYTERQTKRLISEADFPIYSINVWQAQQGNTYATQRRDPGFLAEISNSTGGRQYEVRDLKKLTAATESINLEIRYQYILGCVPSVRRSDGKFHKVKVKVESPQDRRLSVRYRAGDLAAAPDHK